MHTSFGFQNFKIVLFVSLLTLQSCFAFVRSETKTPEIVFIIYYCEFAKVNHNLKLFLKMKRKTNKTKIKIDLGSIEMIS